MPNPVSKFIAMPAKAGVRGFVPRNKNKAVRSRLRSVDAQRFGGARDRHELLRVRKLIRDALELIEDGIGDAETVAYLREALSELEAQLSGSRGVSRLADD